MMATYDSFFGENSNANVIMSYFFFIFYQYDVAFFARFWNGMKALSSE